ncbi:MULTISPECIES: ATP-grasp fold amidoligase family protein [unclassified Actinomyces]|uniref:ATP-grasp fold amidoligase family protein n=1 Tax=unclassified Actinomyces TaxID=2609248 RepID=UPI0013A6E0FA|nr:MULTISPECIES: ATP-grasp fold amidoligase family protein [unclassified Actinomyces]MBW3069366.1 glycosyl transferase [Actinomyces sp. 594]NDR53755.1 glycosyl transferase [Actinomyces sp. 565]
MTVKEMTQSLLSSRAEAGLRQRIYRHNCALPLRRYRAELERWYLLSTGHRCNLDDPRTVGEKIQWLKLYDSTPLKGRLADKFLMREWAAQRVGSEYLVPLLGVWERAEQIDFAALPRAFVLKATHGTRWNIVVPDARKLDTVAARRRLAAWLRTRAAMTGGFELHYEYCQPRVICEPLLRDDSGGLRDYKVMTFNGKVQFIVCVSGRFTPTPSIRTYLPDWSRAPFHYGGDPGPAQSLEKPAGLAQMLEIASAIGGDFALARVDFYEVEGRVYLGEITFTDSNGLTWFAPKRYNVELGDRIVLPDKKPFRGVML